MITVAFCQAFLWMIVMTFYHTGMPTVAQAWYFDTFLRSLEIFCCRYHDEFAGVDMCRAVRWRWKCRQIHQVRPGGHRSARHPIWRPGGSTQRLRSWTRCWFTVATSAFLSSTFGRPKSQKHAIKAGDLGASEHFASRFFLSARSGVYELQRDERRNFKEVSLYSVWGHNPATCSSHLFAFFLGIIFSIPSCITIPFHILRLETCYSPEAFCYAIWPYVSTVH